MMFDLSVSLMAFLATTAAGTEVLPPPEGEQSKPKVEVIERDKDGKATKVSVGERVYLLCSETVQDGCINPRSAGFDWGSQPLDYWPGQTASSLKRTEEADGQAEAADATSSETPE